MNRTRLPLTLTLLLLASTSALADDASTKATPRSAGSPAGKSKPMPAHDHGSDHMPGPAMKAEMAISSWPSGPKMAAEKLIAMHGQPDGVTADMLKWKDVGEFHAIVIQRQEIQHDFPVVHTDYMTHVVSHQVPWDKYDDLAKFDGSVFAERTKGTLAARCDTVAHNLLGLNLAHDVITGAKTADAARQMFADIALAEKNGQSHPYLESLQFSVETGQMGDRDVPMAGKPMIMTSGTMTK